MNSRTILFIQPFFDAYIFTVYVKIRGAVTLKGYIEERAVELAEYIVNRKATVRAAAKKFGVSKSTVHKDITERLAKVNPLLAKQARAILEENKAERHIRGGQATRMKYKVG